MTDSETIARAIADYITRSRDDLNDLVHVQRHHNELVRLADAYQAAKARESQR